MRYLLILILYLAQFRAQASDWLNRTVRVDLIVSREDFASQYEIFERSDQTISETMNNATNGQYPWSVLTIAWSRNRIGSSCVSTVITNDFAVSSLRCVGQDLLYPVYTIEVFIGSVQWVNPRIPMNYVRHFWYITPSPEDSPNIALLRFHESLTFNPNVQPIRLPTNGNFVYEAWSSYISAFRTPTGTFSPHLVSIQSSILSNNLCNFVGVPVPDYEMCGIEDNEPNESGPIMRLSTFSGGTWIVYEYTANFEFIPVLVGIYQYQYANETASFGYATRVSYFVEWITTLSSNPT